MAAAHEARVSTVARGRRLLTRWVAALATLKTPMTDRAVETGDKERARFSVSDRVGPPGSTEAAAVEALVTSSTHRR